MIANESIYPITSKITTTHLESSAGVSPADDEQVGTCLPTGKHLRYVID